MEPSSSLRRSRKRNTKNYPSSGQTPPGSPSRSQASLSAASLIDGEFLTEDLAAFQSLQILPEKSNPRSFPHTVKQQCWEKAEKIKGRDPDRWRRDTLGNILFRKLVGCPGCLCYDYDHIVPYSKGGKSILENCQVLQATVNRSKGNQTEISRSDLIKKSAYCRVSGTLSPFGTLNQFGAPITAVTLRSDFFWSGRDMDLLELTAYGNVHKNNDGCQIQ